MRRRLTCRNFWTLSENVFDVSAAASWRTYSLMAEPVCWLLRCSRSEVSRGGAEGQRGGTVVISMLLASIKFPASYSKKEI